MTSVTQESAHHDDELMQGAVWESWRESALV